ncbi:hypothetical protein NDU88_003509 [Pleurodeles waltl]|uniref:Uncharacterized protein n=1 Tax=Pleurodeles waltl TaxID=8319 RepID=A0AAV7VGU0_PLEWA|nr:hypothetical protein NDU88_003509 [Pleurodeles waltl]
MEVPGNPRVTTQGTPGRSKPGLPTTLRGTRDPGPQNPACSAPHLLSLLPPRVMLTLSSTTYCARRLQATTLHRIDEASARPEPGPPHGRHHFLCRLSSDNPTGSHFPRRLRPERLSDSTTVPLAGYFQPPGSVKRAHWRRPLRATPSGPTPLQQLDSATGAGATRIREQNLCTPATKRMMTHYHSITQQMDQEQQKAVKDIFVYDSLSSDALRLTI